MKEIIYREHTNTYLLFIKYKCGVVVKEFKTYEEALRYES